jgi:hypothetical protein
MTGELLRLSGPRSEDSECARARPLGSHARASCASLASAQPHDPGPQPWGSAPDPDPHSETPEGMLGKVVDGLPDRAPEGLSELGPAVNGQPAIDGEPAP